MGFMHTESAPLLKHDYNYKHTTIRAALGSVKPKKGAMFQIQTDTAAARMDIDSIKRKEPGIFKEIKLIPPKAIRAKLYANACNGQGDFNTILRKGSAGVPEWAKSKGLVHMPPAAAHYSDTHPECVKRYQQIAPRAGNEPPVAPNYPRANEPKVSAALASTLGVKREVPGVDRIGRVDRGKVLAALDPTPPATPIFGGNNAAVAGAPIQKYWEEVHGPKGFFDDPQTVNIDLQRWRKRRADTVKAARLIKDRGRSSALDVLWSNVTD